MSGERWFTQAAGNRRRTYQGDQGDIRREIRKLWMTLQNFKEETPELHQHIFSASGDLVFSGSALASPWWSPAANALILGAKTTLNSVTGDGVTVKLWYRSSLTGSASLVFSVDPGAGVETINFTAFGVKATDLGLRMTIESATSGSSVGDGLGLHISYIYDDSGPPIGLPV